MTLDEIRGEPKALHKCVITPRYDECGKWGPAVTSCYETQEGRLIVDNGEYWSAVNFCPFCGFEAKVKLES